MGAANFTTMDYQKQANDFLTAAGIKFTAKHSEYGKHFADDKENRHIFTLTLSRNGKRVSFKFGQSIAAGAETPTAYDLLTGIEKNDPEDFEWFCKNYGYDTDSRRAERTYRSVCKEWEKVSRFFTADELEQLQEIQ